METEFVIDGKKAIFAAEIQLDSDDNNSDIILRANQIWQAKEFTGNTKQFELPLAFARVIAKHDKKILPHYYAYYVFGNEAPGAHKLFPDKFLEPLSAITEYLSNIKYYSASQFTNPLHCPVSFEIEKEGQVSRGRRLGGHTKFLFDLYTEYKSNQTSQYNQYFDVIGPNGIGLVKAIEFKEILTSSVDYTVRSGGRVRERKREKMLIVPQFTIGRNALSPNQMSEGTFKTITLLFYLMTEKSTMLLIEEPEVCVHHGLLASIVELIRTYSKQKQIIMSTHSDFVLDKVEPKQIYKVTRNDDTGTTVSNVVDSMSKESLKALKDYLASEGNLGEYWKHGGLE